MSPPSSSAAARPRARLFIYDRHDLARESLRELFQDEGFEVVGTDRDPTAAVARILELRPDVCVLDAGMLTWAGVDICRRVRDAAPRSGACSWPRGRPRSWPAGPRPREPAHSS